MSLDVLVFVLLLPHTCQMYLQKDVPLFVLFMSCRSISITYRQPAAGGWPKCQLAPPPAWGPDEPGTSMSCWGSTAPKAQGMTLVWTTLLPWADWRLQGWKSHLSKRPVVSETQTGSCLTCSTIEWRSFKIHQNLDNILKFCVLWSWFNLHFFCLTKVKVFEASLQVLVSLVSLLLMCQAQAIHMDEHFRGIIDFWR